MISRSDDLELLLSVVDCGGFSPAANQLDVPVAKVSRAIQRLEKQLGVTLLQRTTRRISLTEEGELFVTNIRQGLQQLESAEEQLRLRMDQPKGRLRVDAATPFMLHQLVPLLGEFREQYPEIHLELSTSEGIIDLLEKRTDVAIRIGQLEDSSLHATLLGRSRLHLLASPEYLERKATPQTVEQLSDHRLLGFIPPSRLNKWPVGEGLEIKPDLAASSGEVLRQACLAGEGIGCFSDFMVQQDLADGRLLKVLENEMQSPNPREQVQAVYYRNTALSSRINAFIEFIRPRLHLDQ
ncbi:LysR family transcriptional regulator [Pontibacterium granulatum]|uniref:LysR family transcriptional regulator n=1 Tax=Pontibacterium granulatum TaxID=2036029 RepID=UPI00249C4857|nr:LysR family transcriptional regulator [Pontibacterium granulatum]MDI3323285.1 LysR family transcriptional regulator [Pontibacterium granulatum]